MQPLSSSVRTSLERLLQAYPLGEAGAAYLARRRLHGEGIDLPSSGLVFGEVERAVRPEHQKYEGRLVIPSLSARGTPTFVAFRCMEDHDCREQGHSKYLNYPGLNARLFNVSAVTSSESTIHLCEGQLDAATLVACGLPAVGIPGSQAWARHAHRLFQGFDRVCYWADRDDKGASMELFARIQQAVPGVELVHLPEGYDVNSYYVEHGKDALLRLVHDESYDGSADEDEVLEQEGEDFDPYAGQHFDEDGELIPF